MAFDPYRFDDSSGRARRKTNFFGWTVAILLLIGFALTAWLGSFYIFNQPERPQSYKILKKLHKIEPTKRFELTAAPPGEFLTPKQLSERFSAMGPTELTKKNAELARNYIRNFQQVRGLVPYVVGRYTIMEAHRLMPNDVFTTGMVALTTAVDNGEVLMEHIYPADAQAVPLMRQTLVTGLEIKLERTHDLSAVIHADRLADGRLLITAIPLLYGTYTVTRGTGAFTLEPPLDLNLAAGWPLFKEPLRRLADTQFDEYRSRSLPRTASVPIPGLVPAGPPPPPENALVRVESAIPMQPPVPPAPPAAAAPSTPLPKGAKVAKNQKPTPAPAPPAAARPVVAAQNAPAAAKPNASPIATATPPTIAAAPVRPPPTVLPALPVTGDALASTAGGATWKTFPAGKMPAGRLVATTDLREVADRGLAGERIYLKGQFVVNFTESNRAVLRPKAKLTDSVLHPAGGGQQSTRVIVEFPAGYNPPPQGAVVTRDEARPYEITEVRKQADGQLNVFVREIMQ